MKNEDIPAYLEKCRFLPKLNSEIPGKRNSTYKGRFSSLQNLVLIMFEHDTVLIPKETSWFGYYPDGAFAPVLAANQTELYQEDWIGLKTLDDAGRVKFISVAGNHLGISGSDMKTYVVPYLQDESSMEGGTKSAVGLPASSVNKRGEKTTHRPHDKASTKVTIGEWSSFAWPSRVKNFFEEVLSIAHDEPTL